MEPAFASRWPLAELRELANTLSQDTTPCSSYHYYLYSCERDTLKLSTNAIEGSVVDSLLDRDFAKHVLALYKSVYANSCAISKERYQLLCQGFAKRVIGPLIAAPNPDMEIELHAIRMAFTNYRGTLQREGGLPLHYVMQWRRTGIVRIELSQDEIETELSPSLELLALRLCCIMQLNFLQTKPIDYSSTTLESSLTYTTQTPHVAFSLDSQSSSWQKRIRGLPSDTYGVLRITLRPGEEDSGCHYFRFNFKNHDLFSPETLWKLRELLYSEFLKQQGGLPITSLISICKTLFSVVSIGNAVSFIPTNSVTMTYLQTLLPLCLQEHVKRSRQFVQSLVQAYERDKDKDNKTALLLDNLRFDTP